MPPAANGLQRILVKGIPVWRDAAQNLYYYESAEVPAEGARILVGTESAGFFEDWAERLEERLADFRARQVARTRTKA